MLKYRVDCRGHEERASRDIVLQSLYGRPGASLRQKVPRLMAEAIETPMCGCATWGPTEADYVRLERKVHHQMLAIRLGWLKRNRGDHTASYVDASLRAHSES